MSGIVLSCVLIAVAADPQTDSLDQFVTRLDARGDISVPGSLIENGQGEMVGEVTETSAILQSRLTLSWWPIIGVRGEAAFEVSTHEDFAESFLTDPVIASAETDYIVKQPLTGLQPGTRYYYRIIYRAWRFGWPKRGPTRTFRTLAGAAAEEPVSLAVVTGMNWFKFKFFPGPEQKGLGYPGLESIAEMEPDFFVATGDSVYYDAFPIAKSTQPTMRLAWHLQFIQPRYEDLFSNVATYWMKDDHDFRYNDADPHCEEEPSTELGRRLFIEQVPVLAPSAPDPVTYRTHRLNKLIQIWLVENRDYRSPNMMDDGPDKTIWGEQQKAWLKQTLLESDAAFKILISPTPMIGPDERILSWPAPCGDFFKRDNHTNPEGFRTEGEAFFAWLADHGFRDAGFFIVCGDRHWKYHAIRQDGFEEFSCGAICDANSREGVKPGTRNSSDPDGLITQAYTDAEATGGFLKIDVAPGDPPTCTFTLYDENGAQLYRTVRQAE